LPESADATTQDRSDPDAITRPGLELTAALAIAASGSRVGMRLDRYVLGEPIGEGGMGVVHRAQDPVLDRELAIKLLRMRSDATAKARLVVEAKAMAALAHPNVLPIYDVGTVDDEVYLAMELVHGQTLRQWMQHGGQHWRMALQLVLAAGRGLAAAHAIGMVHRDFKPANVLLADDGRVLVTDFGLARADASLVGRGAEVAASSWPSGESSELTMRGEVIGTPAYMAPEMLSDLPVTARSDQFAFCVALYEALYGARPWSAIELAAAVARGHVLTVPSPRRRGGVPRRVHAAIVRGLSWDPAQRWPSMTTLVDALEHAARTPSGRLVAIGAASLALGVGAFAIGDREPPCADGREQLAGVWDPSRRDAVVDAVQRRYGTDELARGIVDALDARADEWVLLHDRTCAAVIAEGLVWADDGRAACLSQRRAQLRTFVDALVEGDGSMLAATDVLPTGESCAHVDDGTLGAADPQERARLREQLGAASGLFAAGAYDETIRRTRDIAAAAEAMGEPAVQAAAEALRGDALNELEDGEPAAEALERAYFLARQAGDDLVARDAASTLAFVLGARLARPADARLWLDHAESAASRLPADPLATASLLTNAGAIAREEGDYERAIASFERALEIRRAEVGDDDVQVAGVLLNLGNVLGDVGRNAEARTATTKALEIWTDRLGPHHPDVVRALTNLGTIEYDDGEYDAALARYGEALARCEKSFGDDEPCVHVHIVLGNVLWRVGRLDEALEHDLLALALAERHYGPDDPHTGIALANVGNVLDARGEHAAAIERWTAARVIWEKALGSDHAQVGMILTNIANARDSLGDRAAALADLERARDVLARALGPRHGHLGTVEHDIAYIRAELGELELAELHYREALSLREDTLPAEHPDVARTLVGLGGVLVDRGRARDAIPLLERAVAIVDGATVDADERRSTNAQLARARTAARR
jgi:tetratricopeptide (TPR) repeat protein/predicted Ser/Thr protein kinase